MEIVYTDGQSLAESINIWYTEDQDIPRTPGHISNAQFRVECSQKDLCYFPEEDDDNGLLLLSELRDKHGVHQLLCSAPVMHEVRQMASRVVLASSPDCGVEGLRKCAQFCFEIMCSRPWGRSALYISIPPPGLLDHDVHDGHAVQVGRRKMQWWVDRSDFTSFSVKLDFAFFPEGASCVQAYFNSDC